jgi:L,D-transpeptidase ErfK/SrfK
MRCFAVLILLWTAQAWGLTYNVPKHGNIVGNIKYHTVRPGENLSTIGRQYDIGGYEMKEANPGVSYLHPPAGKNLTIPSRFILPNTKREGIVVNLAEMRLYFYHPDDSKVSTYPIGIGKDGWNTPVGTASIVRMRKDPTWVVPESILENHRANGKHIEKTMPPGPKNPLGRYAISTGFKNIVIHGSPYPRGIGVRSSHGCMRMWPEDVERLYQKVNVGMSIQIVHEPNKVGISNNQVYLEAHVPISDSLYFNYDSVDGAIQKTATKYGRKFSIQWNKAQNHRRTATGYPMPIGKMF